MGVEALIAITALSAIAGAGGALYSGAKQQEAADYNAAVAEQGARAAQDKASYDEDIHRERVRKLISTQRALYGKSGVEISGSPLLVLEDTAGQGELDALAIRYGGNVNAAQQKSSATLSRMQGSAARTSSYIQAGTSLLTGAGSAIKYNNGR